MTSPGLYITLGEFVRARREHVQPTDVGLGFTGGTRRRTPGLRREELAALAGISLPYLARLEQNRAGQPSAQVLDALARALRLDPTHRAHLHRLAAPGSTTPRRNTAPPRRQEIEPATRAVLDALHQAPALLLGRCTEVLAWNTLGVALHPELIDLAAEQRSMAHLLFSNDATRALFPDWEDVARDTVGTLRCEAGRRPDDTDLATLVDDLSRRSTAFRAWWSEHHVYAKHSGTRRFRHPLVGELTLRHQTLTVAGQPDQLLLVYTAAPGTADADRLSLLGSLAASTSHHM
ncbi:helix-turn-helix domain-containing protein [Mycolicibacterium sp. XJ870]